MSLDVINPFGFLHGGVQMGATLSQATTTNVRAEVGSTYTAAPTTRIAVGQQLVEFRMSDTYSLAAATVTLLQGLGATVTSV